MDRFITRELYYIQPICNGSDAKSFVTPSVMIPDEPGELGLWTKREREKRGLSAQALADRINGQARLHGDPTTVSQQLIAKFEKGENKRMPAWTRFISLALNGNDEETKEDKHLHMALEDASVQVKLLPTFVGLGDGGTGDDDAGLVSFSRDLVERELRTEARHLLAMIAEGNSMEPEFRGGDQILVDTRRKSLAQPGAFCLWDGDGHVIKYLERVPDTDPVRVRVVSGNPIYDPRERLLEEINLVGKVVWYGRRVQ